MNRLDAVLVAATHPFSPTRRRNTPEPRPAPGPSSNTGQKSLSAPIIDFCTVVLPAGALKKSRCSNYRQLLDWIFNTGASVVMGMILDRTWQFYPQSATLIDDTGSVAGKVGFSQDGKICISITGQGCQHVRNWRLAESRLQELGAHLTRIDIAVDDLVGENFDVNHFVKLYEEHEFTTNGRPPTAQFVDDMNSGKGCTFYIGQKGHKQLCIYEKGKQLGDPESKHTRCELRLYAKRIDLPLDAMTNPAKYFAGAYPLLAAFIIGEAEKLLTKETIINASARAMVESIRRQSGTALNLVLDAYGDQTAEELMHFVKQRIARPGRPGRFKKTSGDLISLVRTQLKALDNETHNPL